MIVFVDLEHERIQQDPDLWQRAYAWRLRTKYRLEAISGDRCLIVRYDRLDPGLLRAIKARAVVVSGCYTDFEHYSERELAGLRAVFHQAAWPTLGFCAGQQLMAEAYGARIAEIGPLSPGERDVYADQRVPGHVPGKKAERGFMPVHILSEHPLMAGLPSQAEFFQAHYWELKELPQGFHNLARSPITTYQAIAHDRLPLFGTQFHPEYFDDKHPAGRRLIENFLRIALGWPEDLAGASILAGGGTQGTTTAPPDGAVKPESQSGNG